MDYNYDALPLLALDRSLPPLHPQVRKNLEDLAVFFDTFQVPEKAGFNMRNWGLHPGDHDPNDDSHNHCGTVACGYGWAALSGQFKDRGLYAQWYSKRDADGKKYWYMVMRDSAFLCLDGDGGLHRELFEWLFHSPKYPDAGVHVKMPDIAVRIRRILEASPTL